MPVRPRCFYHGTVSDLDGTPKSTWTISDKDHKTEVDQLIDQDTFAFPWNGMANYRVFKASLVQGADTPLDFYHFQISGIAFRVMVGKKLVEAERPLGCAKERNIF